MRRTNTAVWMEKYNHWQINVQRDGKRRAFYSSLPGRAGQREANAKADAWLDDGVINQKARVDNEYEKFLDRIKSNTSFHNWRTMQNRWTSWIKPQMGNKRISDLCDSDLQHVLDTAFKKKHLAKKTLKNIRGDMSAFVKYCRREKLTTYIPDDITIPAAALDSIKTILQPDSLVKLFSSDMTVDHHKPVFEPYINAFRFQVLTGLRPGELLGLMQSDIRDGIMYIQRSVDITGIITPGKNKNARRAQVLTEAEKQVLADQLGLEESMFIFRIESQQDYRNHLKRYCKANEIPKVTPYELRHTFVSIAKSLPEGVVKPLVGHSVSMDTFGVYGHFLDGDGDKTASLLSDVFKQLLTVKSDAG